METARISMMHGETHFQIILPVKQMDIYSNLLMNEKEITEKRRWELLNQSQDDYKKQNPKEAEEFYPEKME